MNTAKIKLSIGMVLAGILASGVTACANYELKDNGDVVRIDGSADTSTAEQNNAQMATQQHTRAEAMAVLEDAKKAAKRADELGGLWRDTTKLIKKANAALKKNDNGKAYKLAGIAKDHAKMALNQSYLEKANHMIGRVKEMAKPNDKKILGRITESEMAYLDDNGEKAYAMSIAMLEDLGNPMSTNFARIKPQPMEPLEARPVLFESLPDAVEYKETKKKATVRQMESAPAAVAVSVTRASKMDMVDEYKVSSGDSLWTISAKPAIYSNPYQWPLIYKTNKHTIRDPDLIRPGQVLNIDREASEVEVSAAVTHARSRGAWSLGEKEVFDQAYISE